MTLSRRAKRSYSSLSTASRYVYHEFTSFSLASIIPRQCKDFAPPSDFKAFDFGDCTAQLTLTKDRYLGVVWKFEATYPDGSRVEHKPIRDNDNFGVSDPLYRDSGTNFLTQYPNNSAFTAVHEFSSVCEFGQAPVSWRFHLISTGELRCVLDSDTFSSGQIRVAKGRGITRPRQVENVNLRRNTDSGDFRVNWARVTDAVAYSVIVQYPSGRDEIGRPYTSVRGARVSVCSSASRGF